MAGLGEAIGLALSGGDMDREGARLEGLDLGSKISARRASTENALSQARERKLQATARETLADDLEKGGDFAIAASVRSGANPEQVTGAQLDQQQFGNRGTIADVAVPFDQRQAAAQAVEGKVVDPFQYGPGGEFFNSVFSQDDPTLSQTGTAAIGADEALAEDRLASAALDDEKRTHPERFRSSTTINVGQTGLGDAILADISESTIPADIEPEQATGIIGAGKSIANTIFDVANQNLPYPNADIAGNALNDLDKRTQIVGQQSVPGRPSTYLMQMFASFGVTPNDPFRGDQRSLSRMQQTSSFLAGEIDVLRRLLNGGTLTPSKLSDADQALRNLAALKQDFDVVISRFNAGDAQTEAPAAFEAPTPDENGMVTLPSGATYKVNQ